MDFGRCQLPCSRLIASEDQHQVRPVGLAHARDAIFGISYCKYCENFMLKTLRARLAVFDWESAVLPRRAAPDASFLCEAAAWSSEAELEAMESERFSISLLPSPGRHRANSPVQFSRGCLLPSPEARGAVSFRLKNFLYTMASDFICHLRTSGRVTRRPFPAYTELVEVLAHATEKLSLDWPDEPRKSSFLLDAPISGSGLFGVTVNDVIDKLRAAKTQSAGHHLVSSFMCGAKRLRLVHPPSFPSWDLSVVLKGLAGASFWTSWVSSCEDTLLLLLLHFCWHWPHLSVWEICMLCLSASPSQSLLRGLVKAFFFKT